VLRVLIYVALGAVVVPGCAGQQRNLVRQNKLLQGQVSRLRADARGDRVKMRDLRNENFLLKDRLDTARIERDRIGVPTLPVETLTPEPKREQAATEPKRAHPDYQVVGVDRNGAEIVYMGEATKNTSIRPKLIRSGSSGSSASARNDNRRLAPIPKVDDRLPVSKSIPTIDNQMRKASASSSGRRVTGGDARADYHRYYAALRAGNHAYAITGFRNFIKRYPHHDYTDNAQYWLGEAFYDRKDYEKALVEFRRVVVRYPRGNKVPDALLKIGYCYVSLKQVDRARATFKQILTVYPKGRAAELATEQLAKLAKLQAKAN